MTALRGCVLRAHHPALDFLSTIESARRIAAPLSFDKNSDFVLDSRKISPIIYIWYEGGWLSPPVVTAEWPSEAESLILRRKQWRRKLPRARRRRPRRSGSLPQLQGVLVGAP